MQQNQNRCFIITIIFIIFLVIGCRDTNNKDVYIYNSNGQKLKYEKYFFPDGNVQAIGTFLEKDDTFLLHGFYKLFFQTGELKYYANYNMGNKSGSVLKYYKSGNIREYWFYDPLGHGLYMIEYDSLNNIINEKGKHQRKPQVILKKLAEKSMQLSISSANIPNTDRSIYLYNPKGEILDSLINCSRNLEQFTIKVIEGYFKIEVHYIDKLNGKMEVDSAVFNLSYLNLPTS